MLWRMIEIGKQKTKAVRYRVKVVDNGTIKYKLHTRTEPSGEAVTRVTSDEVWRVTREVLGGAFGRDRARKLVVGFVAPDLLSLRPQGTRQEVKLQLVDVYRFALRCAANRKQLELARVRKEKKDRERERRRIADADRRLRRPLAE